MKADRVTIDAPAFEKIDRGATASIAHFWKNKNKPMVRLIHPQTDQVLDFEVLSCASKRSESYMLVGWTGREDERHACVTKIVDPEASKIQILSEEPPADIEWCQADQCEDFLLNLGINVPDLSTAPRQKLSEEQLLFHQLTNQFYIKGEILDPDRTLHIVALTQAHGFAFLALCLNDRVLTDSYSVQHILEIDGRSYCLMSLPPDIANDEPVAPIFVLEISSESSLVTISMKQFELVKSKIIALIKECERQDFDTVKRELPLAEPKSVTHSQSKQT